MTMAMTSTLGFVGSIRHFLVSAARWAWGLPEPAATEPLVIEFLPRTYSADSACGKKRWMKLILRSSRSQWHLKFTVSGTAIQRVRLRYQLPLATASPLDGSLNSGRKETGDSVYKVLLQGDKTPSCGTWTCFVALQSALSSLSRPLSRRTHTRLPNQTTQPGKECDTVVLRGCCLEHHPNGTLESALKSPTSLSETRERWCEWALQIALALAEMHHRGLVHMDLKPSNAVLSGESDAVLTDISGIGGVTRQ
ncbi:hypothetical protein B0T24DRAFT_422220 [Lasiosphaeria ovina]|uniref:Protein kinase domain-containing protein n=1 Tax=Lasiosphaeria ovina TaxID=92902 RepID=A0AAE0MZY5_9PEZI|nr:hypothetical protein B0T24DRAFT_422220 [Lasiosphaeria ovina]